jgi:hypothetical protein
MSEVNWNKPDLIPAVEQGKEEPYWIAVKTDKGKAFVFMAYYQNRPLEIDEHGEHNDDCLINFDGDPIGSVGWVDAKQHVDFDDYWESLTFNEHYQLLGWADYNPPKFTS